MGWPRTLATTRVSYQCHTNCDEWPQMVIRTAKRTHLTRSCVAVPQRAVVSSKEFSTQNLNGRAPLPRLTFTASPLLGLLCLPRIKCPYASGRAIIEAAAVGEKSPKRLRRAGRKQQGTTRTSLAEIGTIISHRSFTGRIVETVHVVLAVSTSTGTLFTRACVLSLARKALAPTKIFDVG